METFTEPKELKDHPYYQRKRRKTLRALTDDKIEKPIIHIINGFNKLPYCFTMQCCYGHFVYKGQKDTRNFEPLPIKGAVGKIKYRIAYIAFCIENSMKGRELIEALKEIPTFDPENVQFCGAEWFWKRHINTYALQVEPDRYKTKDEAILDYKEALHIEKVRNEFFVRLDALIQRLKE